MCGMLMAEEIRKSEELKMMNVSPQLILMSMPA